jgi:hypothetical protein
MASRRRKAISLLFLFANFVSPLIPPKKVFLSLTGAFDAGHVPVGDPLGWRHHSIKGSPLIARLGPCRSMLALGLTGAPAHRKAHGRTVSVHAATGMRVSGANKSERGAIPPVIHRKSFHRHESMDYHGRMLLPTLGWARRVWRSGYM